MLKNRTFLGLICIILALVLVFAVSPLTGKAFDGKKEVVLLKSPIMKGQEITKDAITIVEMGSYNLPDKAITDPKQVINKYATSDLYANSLVYKEMLTDSVDTSDSMLRNLKDNEVAMSVTIKQFANGVSGKLMTGDVIKIVSVNEDKEASLFRELEYIEVLTVTTDNGIDSIDREPTPNDDGEIEMPVTITVILQDNLQALRLAECENTSLHAIFVCRDDKKKSKLLTEQMETLEEIRLELEETEEDENATYSFFENSDSNEESEVDPDAGNP